MNVVITGASRGIGKAIAERFAAAGNGLYLCAKNGVQLNDTTSALQQQFPGAAVQALPADLSQKEDTHRFANWVLQQTAGSGGPQILINNAGTFTPGSIWNEADGALENMLATNLYSAYHLTRALLPRMMENGRGHIFNICSIASLHAYANGGSYSISKFALLGFSRNLREELKPHGIKVTAVLPGAVYTDSWKGSGVPEERIMQADDIASLVFAAAALSRQATVEDIIIRPQLGDL